MNTESKANAAFTSIMLRGGRVTKWKGQVASCAPQVGHLQNVSVAAIAAALAFGGAMAIPSDALAQDVTVVVDSGAPAPAIVAVNSGDGALIINATVPVEGAVTGINAENESTATNLFITATDVQGSEDGIYANNAGTGTTVITTTGNVVGVAYSGIIVSNAATAGALERGDALTVKANNVTGAGFGISARNEGAGSTRVVTSGDVTGTGNIGISVTNLSLANNVAVEANGSVTGGDDGIKVFNLGSGSTSVEATGVVNGGNDGIDAFNAPSTSDLTIDATNTVTGVFNGIRAQNQGSGVTSITTSGLVTGGDTGISVSTLGTGTTIIKATGDVVGTAGAGIDVSNGASTGSGVTGDALTVDVDNVTGRTYGILATNNGAGSTSITATGDVTGTAYDGIKVVNEDLANNLTVETNGIVTGGDNGIETLNSGLGSTSITAKGTVDGGANGIDAVNNGTAKDITITAASVIGKANGVYARNSGLGSVSVTTSGNVEALGGNGVAVVAGPTAQDISVTVNTVTGDTGIVLLNSGNGSISLDADGRVEGLNGNGITVKTDASAKDISLTVRAVEGSNNGIEAKVEGEGDLDIETTGTVTGGVNGIKAEITDSALGGSINIDVVDVTGGAIGINASNFGTGKTTIKSTGAITGTNGEGVFVLNGAPGGVATTGDLVLELNDVTGGTYGIVATNNGTGSTSITATGDVTGTDGDGIYAYNGELANDLTIVANGIVTGGIDGIEVDNDGTGSTTITAEGDVTGIEGDGIDASNGELANNLTIVAKGKVTGDDEGFAVYNFGTGSTSITATGDVTGAEGDGITASNGELATDLTIVANGIVTGDNDGIDANNSGTGSTIITATGDVTGTDEDGIEAFNGEFANDLTIVANGIVTGDDSGIDVSNIGTGSTNITATGDVEGQSFNGIDVRNGATAKDILVIANKVTGAIDGINALIESNGLVDVTINGLVAGGEQGIDVLNLSTSVDLNASVDVSDTGSVTGAVNGINMVNIGTGATKLTSSGQVSGATYGISVANTATGTDVTVSGGDVTGGVNGLDVSNLGTGNTIVTGTGTVTGTTGNGIDVFNAATADSITIAANNVIGAVNGINAQNEGNGVIDVTVTGAVTGGLHGVNATKGASTGDLTVSVNVANTGSVDGAVNGINLVNNTGGSTALASSGKVSGDVNGIFASNGPAAVNLTVSSGDVTGGVTGILAANFGTGANKVSGTGTIVGVANGVAAFNGSIGGTDLTIDVNNVTGQIEGIDAANFGIGNTVVKAIGLVTGTAGNGITARNEASAKDLTVSAATVEGGVVGILVVNNGTGNTSVTVSNAASGGSEDGVRVSNVAGTGAISITAQDVKGAVNAIVANNLATGATAITASGLVEGGTGVAILASNLAGTTATINVTATADVEATSGNAILNDAGNSVLNVANGATISGTIRLGDGSDTANLALASSAGFANITVLDGGDNLSVADGFVDRLNLNGAGTYELDSARLTNWEEINVNAGRVTFSNAAITTGTLGINQGGTLNGSNNLLVTGNVIIATGGTLLAGNANGNAAMRIVGNLTNGGLVDLSGATAKVGDALTINGNYTGAGGQIRFDTVVNGDNSPSDLVLVTGNVGGTSQIAINNVGGVGGATVGDGIKLVQVNGTSTADAFALADDLEVGGFRYDVFLGGVADPNDQDWYLRTAGLSDIAATTLSLARLSDDISMTFLGTLHERVGEQEHLAKRGYQSGGVSGLWGRFIGKGFRERLASKDLGEVKSNGSITGMQLGLDFVRKINGNGSATFAGAYSGYADGSSSDTNIFQDVARRSGGSKSKGWLAGLYGTHYGATGWYANAAVQASFLDAAANAANGTTLKTDARTLLGSLEMGKTLKLGGRMAFEPQLQVIYSNNKFDGAVDSAGTLNEVAIEVSIIGRAGFRLKTTKDEKYNADGGLFSGYLKANLWHNFLGSDIALTSAGQAVGKFEPKKTWVDVGVGTTLTVAKQTEIFFDADVEFGIDQKTTAGTGKIGLRFNW